MELINGTYDRNKIILLYGTEGVGKTTLCGKLFKKVVLADIEDGAFNVDCLKTPHLKSLNELRAALRSLVSNDEIDTIAIDSLTAIEKLAIQVLCKENKVDSLNDLAFGKGFVISAHIRRSGKLNIHTPWQFRKSPRLEGCNLSAVTILGSVAKWRGVVPK